MKTIWITWEHHRRTSEIAKALDDVELVELQLDAIRPLRYAWLLLQTLLILVRQAPDVVIIQSPSIVLALFMASFGKLFAGRLIVDAHNEGIQPFHARYNRLLPVYRFIQRQAALTIVTNPALADILHGNGGRAFVLPDKIPQLKPPREISLNGRTNVVFVCTFEKDEPFEHVIRAARLVDRDTHLYITGRYRKAPAELVRNAAANVTFTGFLSEQDYADLLFSCDAVMDLTLMENCLVCGAYEAVALQKPMILSDTRALRRYFHAGAIYTANDSAAIAQAIRRLPQLQDRLQTEVQHLKAVLTHDWQARLRALQNEIDAPPTHRLRTAG